MYLARLFKSIVTMRIFNKGMSRNIVDSADMFDALQNQWATVGLLDALLLSIALGIPTVEPHPDSGHCGSISEGIYDCQDYYGIVMSFNVYFFLSSICLVILYIFMLNTVPKTMVGI